MFRFTIRDLLWLMVVVGLGVGWWVERTTATRERAARIATDKRMNKLTESFRLLMIENRYYQRAGYPYPGPPRKKRSDSFWEVARPTLTMEEPNP
jgi:hypothetical protein